jgi:hypothetical protein
MEQPVVQIQSKESFILDQIQQVSERITGWLKFLGIVNIISGAVTALSIWGIIIAWLPIWLGVLLFQASNRISSSRYTQNRAELVTMMDKLRLYFLIQGILIIVSVALVIIGVVVFGSLIMKYFNPSTFDSF